LPPLGLAPTSDRSLPRGQVALVTGAASGIGSAVASTFVAAGAAVGINYRGERSAAAADALVSRIVDGGGRALALRGDVSVEAEVVRCSTDSCPSSVV
jgi:NAD(P)-dependent dehydrogenase (short-subunit alcohol dehydrogenase family)